MTMPSIPRPHCCNCSNDCMRTEYPRQKSRPQAQPNKATHPGGVRGIERKGTTHPLGNVGDVSPSSCYTLWSVSMSVVQNALRSSGLRLEMSGPGPDVQTTTSSSTQFAPALLRSVCRLGQEVIVRPLTTSPSTSVHGPWQITATGFPASTNDLANATALGWVRRKSGFATPPGNT